MYALSSSPSDRREAQKDVQQLVDAMGRALQGKQMRHLRTLPNAQVEGHPVSMQLWSFGDKDVVFLGCLYRTREEQSPQLLIQIDSSADDVLYKLKVSLDRK
ncbi:hypothetical protein [Microvirga lenta]|uniref:hypothetical protein n=1 Tax=Microvirga lenta TaxID=2881337 RepID=UPI001CFF7DB4|nr:hypothetical protein [Microvirga lenta]MCB5176566.1 hypothetical protein [Microvirga lenta]